MGAGEGIGNVLMTLPVVDALTRAGHEVTCHLRPSPPEIAVELRDLIQTGRESVHFSNDDPIPPSVKFDLAFLTQWWLGMGESIPSARKIVIAPSIDYQRPEIEQNLEMLQGIVEPDDLWGRVWIEHKCSYERRDTGGRVPIVLHPGCKPIPAWIRKKVYPRWAEVVHRLKEGGLWPIVVGGESDRAIYCGEPDRDIRGQTTLVELASEILRSPVTLSGDSGLHHMGIALGGATVALFGDSSPAKAHHPNPIRRPVIMGPFPDREDFASVSPRCIARACARLARAEAAA